MLGALAVTCAVVVGARANDQQSVETDVTDVGSSEVPLTGATAAVTVVPTTHVDVTSTTIVRTKGTLAPDQEKARAFARDMLSEGFRRFSKSLSPKDLMWARDEIAKRYPGLTMRLGASESSGTVRLTGSIEACFIHDYTGPGGRSSVREMPC